MKYILDTDIIIYFLKGNVNVIKKITNTKPIDLCTTIINHSELYFGAYNSKRVKQNIALIEDFFKELKILPYDEKSSIIFAEHKARLKNNGSIIADLDLMIACIALHHKCTLVTNNTKHFKRIKGLKLENWSEDL